MQDARYQGGAFRLSLDAPGWFFALVSFNANLRSRWLGAPYGDQALFVRRDAFRELGGFAPLPLCEDLDLVRRQLRENWPRRAD